MIRVIERLVNMVSKNNENFTTEEITENKNNISFIIAVILTQLLLLIFGKFLWNNYLVDAVTFVKPIKSIWHLWALSILFKLIRQ